MKLPKKALDPDDKETCDVVRLIYHRNYRTQESEMTKTRLSQVWHEVRFNSDMDSKALRQVADRIQDVFSCDYSYAGNARHHYLVRLKFRKHAIYFSSEKDAAMAKLALHSM
jgi:fido (protein-threonine AMPylation protein)